MKRSQERDLSPRALKRSRYPGPEYEIMREKSPMTEYDRRDLRCSPPRSRDMKLKYYHDEVRTRYREDDYPISRTEVKTPEYRSLCLSNISSKIPDHVLKDALYREFKKYGEFNVNITYSGEMRVAYINFRYPEDAREAKHAKQNKMILFERIVVIDSVYPKKHHTTPGTMPTSNYGRSSEMFSYPSSSSSRRSSPPFQPRRNYHQMRSPDIDLPPRKEFTSSYSTPGGGGTRRAPNEKFPYHLDHVPPEDDDKATRTLFVGNLDYNITDEELKEVFTKYGFLEEIDIKRPQRGQGNAYAFIKFMNLDYAHRAKVEMSGQYIGRFQCKIGYGKVTPSTCIWVGGLGPWVTHQMLEREFDRFGIIERIEWPQGKSYAYVLYDNIDAAQAACSEMRGAPLGGQDRRLRIDFADVSHITNTPKPLEIKTNESGRGYQGSNWKPPHERRDDARSIDGTFKSSDHRDDRRRYEDFDVRVPDVQYRRPRTPEGSEDRRRRRSSDKYDLQLQNRDNRKVGRNSDDDFELEGCRRDARRLSVEKEYSDLEEVENINEMVKCLPVAWNGGILLKNSAFPGRMHVVSGDVTIVDTLMRDPTTTETPMLKIKQRLRLDPPKLDDVGRRVLAAGRNGHCILLAMPSTLPNWDDSAIQQRPLKNLVTYLRQKEAAGVISLPPYETKDKENVGVLYAFPPCSFGYDFLLKAAPRLPQEPIQDDYLIVVVIRGTV
ncbi:RNA-binding protein spenito-like [Saccostrea echinata]|uniref:RNA-binding protein spenito-like n=1 Tax=Saccostrea echinata TaxID=191078 RepID=UPI002A80F571|nr:RNA-binding protein spenito-like [Saccostrea echinata]